VFGGRDVVAGGAPSPELTPQDVDVLRARLFDFWRWACGYPESDHVEEKDPRYIQVTEGRDFGKGYSSCADLAHAGHEFIGNRRAWINRGAAFCRGVNVWRIVEQAIPWRGECAPCDVLVIYNDEQHGHDAHVVCVLQCERALGGWDLVTVEYGQPGGAIKERKIRGGAMGGRLVRVRLPFDVEIRRAFHAGLLGTPRELPIESLDLHRVEGFQGD
jgi:hypothetical protein